MRTIMLLHPSAGPDVFGFIPGFLHEIDPAPAKEQLDKAYFGGWRPFPGFTMNKDFSLSYPGDPVMPPLASMRFRDEVLIMYPSSWVAIVQQDRSYEVARMD